MDISFKTEEGRFNYRVCGIIIHNNKILAMHDERSPYYYLPGGRVQINETAEDPGRYHYRSGTPGGHYKGHLAPAAVFGDTEGIRRAG